MASEMLNDMDLESKMEQGHWSDAEKLIMRELRKINSRCLPCQKQLARHEYIIIGIIITLAGGGGTFGILELFKRLASG